MGIFTNFRGRKAYSSHLMGNQLIEKGDMVKAAAKHNEAMAMYKRAYDEGCREPSILMAYAVLMMRFQRYEEARDMLLLCEKQPKQDPKLKKQLRVNYSVCQWKLGNLDKAIELMQSAASSGKTSNIYTLLGYYLIEKGIQTGDFTEAIALNNEAYEYDEEDGGVLDNLGQLYYAMGEIDKAYDYFSRAYKFKPLQVPTLYFIAKINHERGDDDKARQFIEKCLNGNFSALCSIPKQEVERLKAEIG